MAVSVALPGVHVFEKYTKGFSSGPPSIGQGSCAERSSDVLAVAQSTSMAEDVA